MLFIVADEPDETLETKKGEDASPDNATARKAQLDDTETSKAIQKVDLDLDDAPFLEEDDDEEELLEEEQFELPSDGTGSKEKKDPLDLLRNKFVFGGAAAAMLIIIGALFFLLSGDNAPAPPVVEQPVVEQPTAEMEEPVDPGQMLVRLDPFIIEQRDATGTLRFLEISLVFSTTDPNIAQNLSRETPTVRYALFYYMKNKNLEFLTDQENVDNLKKELLSVTNQYMVAGEFETLLFEQYLVK